MKLERKSLPLLCFLLMFPATGRAQWTPGYGYWALPSGGYTRLSVSVRVTDRPTATTHGDFYAMQFDTEAVDGDGGYIGLQRRGHDHDGTVVPEMAIFSVWGSSDARGPNCARHGEDLGGLNPGGHSCKISYDWNPDRDYTLIVQRYFVTADFYWWAAYIRDEATGVYTHVGRIQVPARWGNLKGNPQNWVEYFGIDNVECSDFQFTRVEFRRMRGRRASNGVETAATPSKGQPGTRECRVSNVNVLGNSTNNFYYVVRSGETRAPLTLSNSYRGAAFVSNRTTENSVSVHRWTTNGWVGTTLPRGTVVQVQGPKSTTHHEFRRGTTLYEVHEFFIHIRLSAHEWFGLTENNVFSDMRRGDYGYNEARILYKHKITSGCSNPPNPQFCDTSLLTRAQVAAFLVRSAKWPLLNPTTPNFSDVPKSHMFYRYIETLRAHGVTYGCGNGKYCPNSKVTKAQMAAFLRRAKAWPIVIRTQPTFRDVGRGHTFYNDIETVYARGGIVACRTGRFCPNDPVSRAEAAVYLVRTFDLR